MTRKHEQEGIDLGHLFRCDECEEAFEVEVQVEVEDKKLCPTCAAEKEEE